MMIDPQHNSTTFQAGRAPVARPANVRTIKNSRSALVPLDQPAEPFAADDLVEHDRLVVGRRIGANESA